MLKSELVAIIAAAKPHLSNKKAEGVINTIFDEISTALAKGGRVELRGFGAFTLKMRGARPGLNPRTGARVSVPDTLHPSFRPSKEMHHRLNGTPGSSLRAPFHKASKSNSGDAALSPGEA